MGRCEKQYCDSAVTRRHIFATCCNMSSVSQKHTHTNSAPKSFKTGRTSHHARRFKPRCEWVRSLELSDASTLKSLFIDVRACALFFAEKLWSSSSSDGEHDVSGCRCFVSSAILPMCVFSPWVGLLCACFSQNIGRTSCVDLHFTRCISSHAASFHAVGNNSRRVCFTCLPRFWFTSNLFFADEGAFTSSHTCCIHHSFVRAACVVSLQMVGLLWMSLSVA